jgi:hypothetical protein
MSEPMGPSKLHLFPQEAHALLWPVRKELETTADRLRRLIERTDLAPDDQAALESAEAAVRAAHATVAALWKETGSR